MVAICSKCGYSTTNSMDRSEFIKDLRESGWSIGKRVLCSSCIKGEILTSKTAEKVLKYSIGIN